MNRVIKYQDPLGNETQYNRDRKGRLTARILKRNIGSIATPNLIDYQQTQYDYDFDGHIIQQQQKISDATGESTITLNTYTNNRLTQTQTYSNANPTRVFETNTTYYTDANGNFTQPQSISRRLNSATQLTDSYAYDAQNRIISHTLPDGTQQIYTYANANQSQSSRQQIKIGSTLSPQLDISASYNIANQLQTSTDAKGNISNYTFDARNRLLTLTNPLAQTTTLTYSNDVLTQINLGKTATLSGEKIRDSDRTSINLTLPNESYQYDGVGNRTQNNSVVNLYDNNNRINKIGATVITHNAAGSLTQNGTSAYTYNSEQRLTQTVKSGVTTLYKYDAFGRRVAKNSGGVTTFYVWDNENLIAEYNTAGQRTKRYAYIPNRYAALQVEDANGIYQVHTNHLDTPTQLTDSTQKIVWQANYQAFGNTNINQDPDANGIAIIYNQRFPGQYQDVETNLYYNFYRDYDPSMGRYLQSDPIGLGGGINLYSYVGGNPLYWVDPFGLTREDIDRMTDYVQQTQPDLNVDSNYSAALG